jgi:hypothetical protein
MLPVLRIDDGRLKAANPGADAFGVAVFVTVCFCLW